MAGNFRLLVALGLSVGEQVERHNPVRVSFFGWGGWMHPGPYLLLVAGALLVAVYFLSMSRKSNSGGVCGGTRREADGYLEAD